jgi:hypothetical protein
MEGRYRDSLILPYLAKVWADSCLWLAEIHDLLQFITYGEHLGKINSSLQGQQLNWNLLPLLCSENLRQEASHT